MSTVENFKKNKFVVIKNAVDLNLINFVTQYALFDEMKNFSPEGSGTQVPLAHSKYADPAMEAMLLHVHPLIEKFIGLKLYPTYSYYRVYRNGDKLEKHKDRESCEISATLSFNFSYSDSDYRWPIYIEGNAINLDPGDMVIYRGIDVEHWRNELVYQEDVWHVQAFLHFVDANGPVSEWKYDKRNSIGEPKPYKNDLNKKYIITTGV